MSDNPIFCTWDGEAFKPLPRHHNEVNDRFVVGERYRIEVMADRSAKSHNHFFAALSEMWSSIPEDQTGRFPTVEHLRKWALIQTGWHDRHEFVASSKAEALRIAAFMRASDEYAAFIVQGAAVARLTARSQSVRAMGKDNFQKSKQDVLDCVANLIGVKAAA